LIFDASQNADTPEVAEGQPFLKPVIHQKSFQNAPESTVACGTHAAGHQHGVDGSFLLL